MQFNITVTGDEQIAMYFRNLPNKLRAGVKKALSEIGYSLLGHIRSQKLSGQALKVRSGTLRGSVAMKVIDRGKELYVQVGTNKSYARIHEYGGTITGRPWLTIPLPEAKTAAGVVRMTARSWPDTFIQKSKAGNIIIFQNQGDDIIPLFVLKRSVDIPERPYMRSSLKEKTSEILSRIKTAVGMAIK
jgi:phage gpG-like protein